MAVVTLVFLILVITPAVLFPVLYGFQVKWYKTHVGRAMMIHALGMAGLMFMSLLYRALGIKHYAYDWIASLFILLFLLVGLWYILIAYLVERRRSRGNRNGHREEH